jgi:uncharacterized membrane protein
MRQPPTRDPASSGSDRRRRRPRAAAAVRAAVLAGVALLPAAMLGGGDKAAAAAPPSTAPTVTKLTLATPYPAIDTQPGSTVRLDVKVSNPEVAPVDLEVDGVPDGWRATLRGGGFVIHAVTAAPDAPVTATLEIDVAPDAAAGEYPLTITGTSDDETATVDITLRIAEQVDSGIELTADFPSLRGEPATDFTYNLTITNNTPEEQTFTFDPSGPQGWTVSASPTAEARAETVTIEAGGTGEVRVTATPPESAEEGEYPIDVTVTAANGATGQIQLTAEVTGTPKLELATADQRLDVSGSSNSEHRIPLIVANTGTATLEDVKLAGTAPSGWDVSFEPTQIDSVRPSETAQVTAIVKPASNAVAGDYALSIRASAGSQSSSLDLRYSLKGSRTLGFISLGVIAAAVAALAGVFVRFGRR